MSTFELFGGFFSVSVGLLWETDDTSVYVGFSFLDKLEDVALDILLIIKRREFQVNLIL